MPCTVVVYAVGHALVSGHGRRWAAVHALGGQAFVSHQSAADAFGFRKSDSPLVHVTVRGRGGRERREGIRIHRPRALPDDEVTRLAGLPVTTAPRTLLDLAAAGLRGQPLEAAVDRAERLRLVDFAALHRLVARYPRPLVNTVIEGSVRDFYWPDCRLVIEADSYGWHRSPSSFNDDRERDVELTLAGYRTLRFTYEQVTERPRYVMRAIVTALGAG